ncbi:MAG: helix-turn-helix domain-containing protein [Candidatus Nanoarchaeia archaeon]|jgi:predicted transcriptional regulator
MNFNTWDEFNLCKGKKDLDELASELGITRQMVNRILQNWEEKGLVDWNKKGKKKYYFNFEEFLKEVRRG